MDRDGGRALLRCDQPGEYTPAHRCDFGAAAARRRPLTKSADNVEVILRGIDASNRRDADAFLACLHPDVEWEENGDTFPGLGGLYRGWAEVRAWFEEAFGSLWESGHTQVEEIIDAGDDRVLLRFRRTARGRSSGAETELRAWNVFWLANGKVARREGPYWNRADALEAVGLYGLPGVDLGPSRSSLR